MEQLKSYKDVINVLNTYDYHPQKFKLKQIEELFELSDNTAICETELVYYNADYALESVKNNLEVGTKVLVEVYIDEEDDISFHLSC